MTIKEVVELIDGKVLTGKDNIDSKVFYGYSCDLLSHVMAHATENSLWVTVQTHVNVVAVAMLLGIVCIVVPEEVLVEPATLDKAQEKGIAIVSTKLDAFSICGRLYKAGIRPCT